MAAHLGAPFFAIPSKHAATKAAVSSVAAAGLVVILAAPWHLQVVHLMPKNPEPASEVIRIRELLKSHATAQATAQESLGRKRTSERLAAVECNQKALSAIVADPTSFTVLPSCESGEVGHTRNFNLAAHQWLWAKDHVESMKRLRDDIATLDSDIRRRDAEIKSLHQDLRKADADKQAEDHAKAHEDLWLLRVSTLGAIGAFASGLWRRRQSRRMPSIAWLMASAGVSVVVAGIFVGITPFQGSVAYSIALMSGLVLEDAIHAVKALAKLVLLKFEASSRL